ncbi:MAG TPA: tetratricopeptide repeat protein [Bacteroidia bacterium]|nr:tetratricopeptide repeat protein [Bacteroidia bacterium]
MAKLNFKYCILVIFLVSGVNYSFAQTRVIDSVRHRLLTDRDDTNKINDLDVLSFSYYPISPDTTIKLVEQTLPLAKKLGFKKGEARTDVNGGIGYCVKGDFPKALEYFLQALDIDQQIGDKYGIATVYVNMGTIYDEQGDYAKGLDCYYKALDLAKRLGRKQLVANALANIGVIYKEEKKYPEALDCYTKALAENESTGNKSEVAILLANIGNIYLDQNNYAKALEYCLKAVAINKKTGDISNVAYEFNNMGGIYTRLKNYKLAKALYDSSLYITARIGEKNLTKDDYRDLSTMDSSAGNYKDALKDYKYYIIYRDSLVNEANTKKTVQAEMNFQFEQKQAVEKAEQDKKDAIVGQEKKKQTIIRNAFIAGFSLMLALAFFIFRGYRQKQSANVIITQQKAVVEEKQKEILDSIHYAQRIQKALLASDAMLSKHLSEYFVLYKPKDIVSGDFYWATEKGNSFYLAVCDSTGHGVPGAFMSLLNISFLNEAITEKNIAKPNEVFNHARKRLIENISQDGQQDGMDGVLIKLENGGGASLSYSAAYNPPIIMRNQELIELGADKMAVGASPKQNDSFTTNTFDLQKGDTLYLFTDGYADQFGGAKGKKFKYAQLSDKLKMISNESMKEQQRLLNQTFESWKGRLEQVDDVLIIGVRV